MYISIDCDNMKFLRKHKELHCVANLAWIENHNDAYCISSICDARVFLDFTLMELGMLYENTTKEPIPNATRNQFAQMLFDLASKMKETDVNEFELDIQARFVKESDETKYRYCKGASRPSSKEKLFKEIGIVKAIDNSIEKALDNILPDVAKANERKLFKAKKSPNRFMKGPARGTAKAIIWETADSMWKALNEPTVKKEILELRKEIMNKLEKVGIKRSSASSELGKWHKERVPE